MENPSPQHFTASMDGLVKFLTGFILLFPLGGLIMMIALTPWYPGFILFVIMLITILGSYAYSVKGYAITSDALIIQRRLARLNKEIPFTRIYLVRQADKGELRWTIRVMGDGGVFGYYGSFVNNKLGYFTMYATHRKNTVIIELLHPNKTIVLSPDDLGFVEALKGKLHK